MNLLPEPEARTNEKDGGITPLKVRMGDRDSDHFHTHTADQNGTGSSMATAGAAVTFLS